MSGCPRPAVSSPVAMVLALLSALAALSFPGTAGAAPPSGEPVKFYVVQDSFQGKPEFLFEIAQRFLGSGNRNKEIFELNKGRTQPDGLTVTSAAEILPGWVLELPADAKGDGVQFGPLPLAGPSAGASAPSAPDRGGFPWWIAAVVAAAFALAGGAVWLRGRGGLALPRRKAPVPATPADRTASWTVDRALRTLASACAEAGRPLPDVYAVTLGSGEMALRLTAPDDEAPAPWSPDSSSRTWTAQLQELQVAAVDQALGDPYPRLVTAGVADGSRVLLDLSQAHGVIGLDGDARVQRTVTDLWTAELAANPWSKQVTVVRVGFGTPAPGATSVGTLREAQEALAVSRGGVLLLASPPAGREAAELQALLGTPGSDWAVVIAGGARDARWRFTAVADGHVDTGFLGMRIYVGAPTDRPALLSARAWTVPPARPFRRSTRSARRNRANGQELPRQLATASKDQVADRGHVSKIRNLVLRHSCDPARDGTGARNTPVRTSAHMGTANHER